MVFERSENEPDEYDPEAEFEDPESDSITIPDVTPEEPDNPTVSAPEVSIPEVSTDETDVPKAVFQHFWAIVVAVNAALLAFSLGAMLFFIQGMTTTGGVLAVGGLVLFGLAYRRYRAFQSQEPLDSEPSSER